jgi:hypothetical protein
MLRFEREILAHHRRMRGERARRRCHGGSG